MTGGAITGPWPSGRMRSALRASSRGDFCNKIGHHRTLRPRFASSFVSSRALLMNSCASGLSFDYSGRRSPTGTRLSDCMRCGPESTGNAHPTNLRPFDLQRSDAPSELFGCLSSLGRCCESRLLPCSLVQSLLPEAVQILACRAWATASNAWAHQLFRRPDRRFRPIPPRHVHRSREQPLPASIAPAMVLPRS
jgi:hypothetical protein